MPRARDEHKIVEIYAAVMKLVTKTGFNGLKMADVAKEAGVATGTLYIYFNDKAALVNQAYIATLVEITEAMPPPMLASDNFFDFFRKSWFAYFSFCANNPEKMLFIDQFLHSGLLYNETIEQSDSIIEAQYQVLLDAQKNGLIRQLDVALIAAQVTGAIHEIIETSVRRNIPLNDNILNECFEMAWNSIQK